IEPGYGVLGELVGIVVDASATEGDRQVPGDRDGFRVLYPEQVHIPLVERIRRPTRLQVPAAYPFVDDQVVLGPECVRVVRTEGVAPTMERVVVALPRATQVTGEQLTHAEAVRRPPDVRPGGEG